MQFNIGRSERLGEIIVRFWSIELKYNCAKELVKVILGNKCDLESKVSFDEVEVYAKE